MSSASAQTVVEPVAEAVPSRKDTAQAGTGNSQGGNRRLFPEEVAGHHNRDPGIPFGHCAASGRRTFCGRRTASGPRTAAGRHTASCRRMVSCRQTAFDRRTDVGPEGVTAEDNAGPAEGDSHSRAERHEANPSSRTDILHPVDMAAPDSADRPDNLGREAEAGVGADGGAGVADGVGAGVGKALMARERRLGRLGEAAFVRHSQDEGRSADPRRCLAGALLSLSCTRPPSYTPLHLTEGSFRRWFR